MALYGFARGALMWIASVACLFPLTIPLLYLAFRIREGRVPENDETGIDNDELWKRSAIASAVLAAATFAAIFVDVVAAKWADAPAGVVHFVILLLYFAMAAFIVMVVFAYEDFFAALGQLTIFLIMPIIVLFPLNALLGLWNFWLKYFDGWLKAVT